MSECDVMRVYGNCDRCDSQHVLCDPCPHWALQRKLLSALIDKFDRETSADAALVFDAAGGLSLHLWGRVVMIAATNPDAIKQIAQRLREFEASS